MSSAPRSAAAGVVCATSRELTQCLRHLPRGKLPSSHPSGAYCSAGQLGIAVSAGAVTVTHSTLTWHRAGHCTCGAGACCLVLHCCTLPLLQPPLAGFRIATNHALLALVGKAINSPPLTIELTRRLHHLANEATLGRHFHMDEGLLAAPFVSPHTLLASAFQPITAASFAAEALYCLGLPALLALLLLRRLPFCITVTTPSVRTARQAAAFAATPGGGILGKPSRQGLVAGFADLRLLCGWMVRIAQPAQHACIVEVLAGITGWLWWARQDPGVQNIAMSTHGARQDSINLDTD